LAISIVVYKEEQKCLKRFQYNFQKHFGNSKKEKLLEPRN